MARSRRRLLLVLGGALPLALACNTLVGLSDYERQDCSGGPCFDGAAPDVFTPRDAGPDVELADAEGSRPVAWAHFVMPNAQDGGMRDAGFPIENIPEYIEVSGGLQDSITKRVWRVPVETDKIAMTFKAAQDVCAKAVGWRVPTRIELVSLLDFSDPRPGQKRLSAKFGDPGREPYWTTSELRTTSSARTGENWAVQFGTGTLPRISTATGQAAVLCVKGGGS